MQLVSAIVIGEKTMRSRKFSEASVAVLRSRRSKTDRENTLHRSKKNISDRSCGARLTVNVNC